MTVRRAPIVLVLLLCRIVGVSGVLAQAPPPLTPGAAAALVLPKNDEARARLAAALSDADVRVRTVAARVAAVSLRTDLVPALSAALAREQDGLAAAEQTRAIVLLNREAGLPLARQAADLLGGRVRLVLAEWLARNTPQQFAAQFAALGKGLSEDDIPSLARIAAMAVQQTPVRADAVTDAVLGSGLGGAWRSYLDALAESGSDCPHPGHGGGRSDDLRERLREERGRDQERRPRSGPRSVEGGVAVALHADAARR